MINHKELLKKLPGQWSDLKLKDYIKLAPVINGTQVADDVFDADIYTAKIESDLDKSLSIISLLTDVTVEELEAKPMTEVTELIGKLSFMNDLPNQDKPVTKYKKFTELTYDGFITFEKLQRDISDEGILGNAISNLPVMLSVFSKDGLTPEQIEELSMSEVIASFFILEKNIQKYLRSIQRSLLLQVMKNKTKEGKQILTQYLKNLNPFNRNSRQGGTIG